MNELIEQLKSRVGLDDQKAQAAAQTVLEFIKQRLPPGLAGHLDALVAGQGLQGLEGLGGLGGLFGRK